jgi:hypothetical protein
MRKLIFLAVTALLALPALAVAGSPPSPASQAAAVKQCTTERNANAAAFKLTYGTLPTRSNAFGKCVSKLAQQNEQEHANAAAQCRTERSGDPTGFAANYGTGPKHMNAFGNCVSQKAKLAAAARVAATKAAFQACWTERKADVAAFRSKYGTNANKSNAFGKCVSAQVKQSNP